MLRNRKKRQIAREMALLVSLIILLCGCRKAQTQTPDVKIPDAVQNVAQSETDPVQLDLEVTQTVRSVSAEFEDEKGYVAPQDADAAIDAVAQAAQLMLKAGVLQDVCVSDTSVWMCDANGITTVYQPALEDFHAAGDDIRVMAFDPFREAGSSVLSVASDFSNDADIPLDESMVYENDEVTLEILSEFKPNSIILWEGHGGCNDRIGPFITVRTQADEAFLEEHHDWFQENLISKTDDGNVLVCAAYFDMIYEAGDLNNCLIYFNCCGSMASDELGEVLCSKGAAVFCGNTHTVSFTYAKKYSEDILSRFAQGKTIEECYDSVWKKYTMHQEAVESWEKITDADDLIGLYSPKFWAGFYDRSYTAVNPMFYGDKTFTIDQMRQNAKDGTVIRPKGISQLIDLKDMTYEEILKTVKWAQISDGPIEYASDDPATWWLYTEGEAQSVSFEFYFEGEYKDPDEKPLWYSFNDNNMGKTYSPVAENVTTGMTYSQIREVAPVGEAVGLHAGNGNAATEYKSLWHYGDSDITLIFAGENADSAVLYMVIVNGDYDRIW